MRTALTLTLALVLGATTAHAGSLTFDNEVADGGSGFGNVVSLLSLQDQEPQGATDGKEYGSVEWDGSDDTDQDGNTFGGSSAWKEISTGGTQTVSLAELKTKFGSGLDVDDLGVIFNVNETGAGDGKSVTLFDWSLLVFAADGTTKDTLTWSAPVLGKVFDVAGQGTGTSGYLFRTVGLSSSFNLDTDRLGLQVLSGDAIENVDNGQDNFYVGEFTRPVPEPATLSLVALGGLGLLASARRRRRI